MLVILSRFSNKTSKFDTEDRQVCLKHTCNVEHVNKEPKLVVQQTNKKKHQETPMPRAIFYIQYFLHGARMEGDR